MGIEPTRGRANDPSTALKAAGSTRRPDTPRKSDCTLHYWKPQVPVFRRSRVRRSGCCYNELMFRLVVIVALVVAASVVAGLGMYSFTAPVQPSFSWSGVDPQYGQYYWLKDSGQDSCLYMSSFDGWLRFGIIDDTACPGKDDDEAWVWIRGFAKFPLTEPLMEPTIHIPGIFVYGRLPVGFGNALRGLGVSHGFVCVALVAYPAGVLLTGLIRRTRWKNSGVCFRCGYNLTGNVSGICPECGSNTRPNHDARVP